jgi:hypothetical protein
MKGLVMGPSWNRVTPAETRRKEIMHAAHKEEMEINRK